MPLLNADIKKKNRMLPLILILLAGSFLRFYGLENQSLWNDELSGWIRSRADNLETVINEGVRTDVHPPAYHIFLYFIEKYIGDSELILRFPSVVSGVLSILIIFLLGVRLYSRREGLIASALMAFLWCPIHYSQEARAYSILLLFSSLATYFWILILHTLTKKLRISNYVVCGYIITAIISCYLHYFGLYLIALQGLYISLLFIRKLKASLYILLIYSLIFLAYLPWLPIMLAQLNIAANHFKPPSKTAFLGYLGFFFNKKDKIDMQSAILLLIILVFYSSYIFKIVKNILKNRKCMPIKIYFQSPDLLVVLWLLIPFAVVYIKSLISEPILIYYSLIISTPAAYLLLARSITQLATNRRNQIIITIAVIGVFLSHLIFSMNYYTKPHKDQFREAVGYIIENDHLYDDSLIIGYAWNKDYFNYYFEKKSSNIRVEIIAGEQKDISKVDAIIDRVNPKYVWFVRAHKTVDSEFFQFLNNKFRLMMHKKFYEADVWIFENI